MTDKFDALVKNLSKSELDECAASILALFAGDTAGKKRQGARQAPLTARAAAAMAAADEEPAAETAGSGETVSPEAEDGPGKLAEELAARAKTAKRQAEAQDAAPEREMRGTGALESGTSVNGRVLETLTESYVAGQPHRRYENAVGRRRLEMSRVSDYFSRDSRRYDAGFEKY